MREFILCFDPPITIDNWDRVAETLNQKLMFWSNHEKTINYSPFLRESTKMVSMLAYNRWPHEENPVLTWDSECKVDPQDTLFGKLPILDGWQWVEENSIDYDETSSLFDSLNEDVKNQTPRVGDYLLCHKDLVMDDDGYVEAIAGKFYPIIDM